MNTITPHALPPTADAERRLFTHLLVADVKYFVRHPDAEMRRRAYFPGECPVIPPGTAVAGVLVLWRGNRMTRVYLRVEEEERAA